MDPRFHYKKGYDTDLVILRSIFALDPNTNRAISSFYAPVADGVGGVQWLSLDQYFSSGTGILNFVSSVQSFSTQTGLYSNFSTLLRGVVLTSSISTTFISSQYITTQNIQTSTATFLDLNGGSSIVMNFSAGDMYVSSRLFYNPNTAFTFNLYSTVAGLGTAKYISAAQLLSTIDKLGSNGLGYVNTPSLVSTTSNLITSNATQFPSTVRGLGTAGYISTAQLISSMAGLGTAGYLSSVQLTSTVAGLGTAGYVSSPQLISTVTGLGSAGYISSSQLVSTVIGLGGIGLVSTGQLNSSLVGIGTLGYLSTPSLVSTVANLGSLGYLSTPSLVSTVANLGSLGYLSTPSLVSSVANLGSVGYISSAQLTSTTAGAATAETGFFISTVAGLGTARYISSSQLQSTILGLGGSGLVSTGQLTSTTDGIATSLLPPFFASTVANLGRASYISTSQLVSTTAGVLASITPATGTTVGNLVSTVAGLGNSGYVSTTGLGSTVVGLQNSFLVVNASQVFVNNSRLSISSVGTFIFFSTFMNSSITYQGNNGAITASNGGVGTAPLYFSTANLNIDRWSSFINAQSLITIEAYPQLYFANLGLTSNPTLIYMSSFIQAGGSNHTSSYMFQSAIYPTTYSNNQSNPYYQPIKLTIPGSVIQGFYPQPTRLAHYLPNAVTIGTTQGFSNSNVSIFYGSTNSVFLSVQNLPL